MAATSNNPGLAAALAEIRRNNQELLDSIKRNLSELKALLNECESEWGCEDAMYRFYRQSFKVYKVQDSTEHVVASLQGIMPEHKLADWFMQIVNEGTGKVFNMADNDNWLHITRPMIEAYFHALFFLKMAVLYGEKFESVPEERRPYGWVALLDLYDIR